MVTISAVTNRVWGFANSPFRYNLGIISSDTNVTDINFVGKTIQTIDITGSNATVSVTQSTISELKIPLRPDNVGSLDVQFMKSKINCQSTLNVFLEYVLNNYVRFDVLTGFECNPNITFSNVNNISGKVGLNVGGATTSFRINDEISIDLDFKFDNPEYDTTTTVTGFSSSNIVTNIDWGFTSSATQSGEIFYTKRYTNTSSDRIMIEGVVQYDNLLFNLENKYVWRNITAPNWTTAEYLTNYPYNYNNDIYTKKVYINETPYETINFLTDGLASFKKIKIVRYTNDGSSFEYIYDVWSNIGSFDGLIQVPNGATSGTNAWRMFELGIGPKNIYDIIDLFGDASGTYEEFWTDNNKYSITFISNTDTESKTLWRKISCYDSVYPIRQLCFKNQLGGYDYFNFKEKSTKKINIEKNNFKKPLDPIKTIYVNQNLKQVQTINVRYDEEFTASTEFLTESEYNYLNELLLSEDVYVVEGLFKKPVQIIDTQFNYKTYQNQDLFILSINYKYSFDRLA